MALAEVILWGKTIGAVSDDGGDVKFSYNPDFIRSGIELAPLALPLNNTVYSFPELRDERPYYGLPGMLADSLPDKYGEYMIAEYLRRFGNGRLSLSPVEKLCYAGTRGMGALEYKPSFVEPGKCENIDLDELTVLAEGILAKRRGLKITEDDIYSVEDEEELKHLLQVSSSAGGSRAKALIAWNEETGEIRSGQLNAGPGFGYWLIKLDRISNNYDKEDKPDDADSTRVEYAYYLMAREAGIDMAESKLLEKGKCAHFVTRRFDRYGEGKKIHMISLCGMSHMNFKDSRIYDYYQVADIVDRVGLGKGAIEKIFTRMVFNDMTFNFDDHVKNTSFLMNQKGEWSLSPAYDMTYAYDKDGKFTYAHQMLINGKSFGITPEDYMASGKKMGLTEEKMRCIISQVGHAVRKFESFAEMSGVPEEKMKHIKELIDSKKYI